MELVKSRNGQFDSIKEVYMEYATICGVLIFIVLLSTLYTKLNLSQKKRIIVDSCSFLIMLVVTIILSIPNNLLLVGLLFLIWIVLGNFVGHFYPKLWFWIENQYLKKQGIPCSQRADKEETGNTFVCKLLYFTIELGLIVIFFRSVIVNIIQ